MGLLEFRVLGLGFGTFRIQFCWVEAAWNGYWLDSQSIRPQNILIFSSNWGKLFSSMEGTSSTTYSKVGVDRCRCIWCDRWGTSGNRFFPCGRSVFSWWFCSFMGIAVLLTVLTSPPSITEKGGVRHSTQPETSNLANIRVSKEPHNHFYSNFFKYNFQKPWAYTPWNQYRKLCSLPATTLPRL